MTALVALLLVVAVGSAAVTVVGVLAVREPFDRLHLLGPVQTLGALALALAVIVHAGPGEAATKAAIALVLLVVTGPVTTHALGRAAYVRRDRVGEASAEDPRVHV